MIRREEISWRGIAVLCAVLLAGLIQKDWAATPPSNIRVLLCAPGTSQVAVTNPGVASP